MRRCDCTRRKPTHLNATVLRGARVLVNPSPESGSQRVPGCSICCWASCKLCSSLAISAEYHNSTPSARHAGLLPPCSQGVHLAVNTSLGNTTGSCWLDWAATEQGQTCPPGTEPLAFIEHLNATGPLNASASIPSMADCIAKLSTGQHSSRDQPLLLDRTAGGFWAHIPANLSGPDSVLLGFQYNWTTDGGNTSGTTDGMHLLSALGQMPASFYDHGFSAAASSQQGLISLGVPPGSYSLQFESTQVCLPLALVLLC